MKVTLEFSIKAETCLMSGVSPSLGSLISIILSKILSKSDISKSRGTSPSLPIVKFLVAISPRGNVMLNNSGSTHIQGMVVVAA